MSAEFTGQFVSPALRWALNCGRVASLHNISLYFYTTYMFIFTQQLFTFLHNNSLHNYSYYFLQNNYLCLYATTLYILYTTALYIFTQQLSSYLYNNSYYLSTTTTIFLYNISLYIYTTYLYVFLHSLSL